jgi:hypothetical protein
MSETSHTVRTTLRIPGTWGNPRELLKKLPEGVRITAEKLVLADGSEFDFSPMPPDEQFASVFKSSCRRNATDSEQAIVDRYTVNVAISGPGGSMQSAAAMMRAGAAIVRAGGAGVFIDNSALAHGGEDWIEMTDDASPDALSFAFTSIVRGQDEIYTVGLHVLGLPDIAMRPAVAGADSHGDEIIELLLSLCRSDRKVSDGDVVVSESGQKFKAVETANERMGKGSPMFNPFGRLKMISLKDLADLN